MTPGSALAADTARRQTTAVRDRKEYMDKGRNRLVGKPWTDESNKGLEGLRGHQGAFTEGRRAVGTAGRSIGRRCSDQRRLVQGKDRLVRRESRRPSDAKPRGTGGHEAGVRYLGTSQGCLVAAGVVMVVRPRRAILPVVASIALRIGAIVGVVVIAACRDLLFPVLVIQREHTAP